MNAGEKEAKSRKHTSVPRVNNEGDTRKDAEENAARQEGLEVRRRGVQCAVVP